MEAGGAWRRALADYAAGCSLHGLRYTAPAAGLAPARRLFWALTFLASAATCVYFITNVYHKWDTSPVIVTVGERPVSAASIPFPAVTVCPQMKCRSSVYNFTKHASSINESSPLADVEEFKDIAVLCQYPAATVNYTQVTNLTIIDRIMKVSPQIRDVIVNAEIKGNTLFDLDMFSESYTAEGLCFTFNGVSPSEVFRGDVSYNAAAPASRGWSLRAGYDFSEARPYPHRGALNSRTPDLNIIFNSENIDEDSLCNGLKSGYKIYLGHPADAPQASLYYYAALNGQLTSLAVRAEIFSSPPSLRSYSVSKRQCYFHGEKYLRYFQLYTLSNCQAECLSNITRKRCKCVSFFMPHEKDNVAFCTESNEECVAAAHLEMAQREAAAGAACRCLPPCDSIEYDAEVLKTENKVSRYIDRMFQVKYNESLNLSETYKFSSLEVYFKKPQFIAMHRSELFGITDFVANIGGLLGLFLGFSFLSLVEIFYYIIVTFCCSKERETADERKTA